ncbi:MAG: branched-chain amino acid ABC transporter substrate-binding protein [Hyphomicrobiaceae bacterium]
MRARTTTGRQPSRLPFGLLRLLQCACVALAALSPAPAMAQAADRDIVIMAVDSSRVPEADSTGLQAAPHPVGEGVEEVARHLNAQGGLLGRRLRVARENDRCEAEEAAAIAARAAAEHVDLIIGHICASGAIRAAEIYAAAGIVMIATGPRHPRLTRPAGRRGVHRLAGRDDRQGESIAALIATSFPAARVAIIHDRSLQGRGMADEIRRSAIAAQISPVLVATYTSSTKNYAHLVGELAAARVNLVVFPGQLFEASMILDQADRAGARIATVIGTDVLAAEAPPARLLAAVDDFLVMLPWPGMGRSAQEPTRESVARALAGAALEAWSAAIIEAGDTAPDRVSDSLRGRAHATRVGAVQFDARGDAVVPSYLPHVWRHGRWQAWR